MMRNFLILFAVLNVITVAALYYVVYLDNKKCTRLRQTSIEIDRESVTMDTGATHHTDSVSNGEITTQTTANQSTMIPAAERTYDFNSCTVLIATYKRNKLLMKVLSHLCSISSNETTRIFSKIIVSWNNINTVAPDKLTSLSCPIPILFKYPKQNVLYNKFIHYPEIETQCKSVHYTMDSNHDYT